MPTLGIPRSLLYYYYHPAWEGFFKELGAKVKISPPSNEKILELGLEKASNNLCLPFKLLYGHVLSLSDEVDFVFLPRIMSVAQKEYLCPKFFGLPDLFKNTSLRIPPIIAPLINIYHQRATLGRAAWQSACMINRNPRLLRRAVARAFKDLNERRQKNLEGEIYVDGERRLENPSQVQTSIGILGHSYLVLDSHLSKDLINYLQQKGVEVVLADNLRGEDIKGGLHSCPKDIFWTFNKKIWGAGISLSSSRRVAGLIQLSSFGCGPDSILTPLLQNRLELPFLVLNIDEHTGRAGLETRLEAFLDLVQRWPKNNEKSYLSSSR